MIQYRGMPTITDYLERVDYQDTKFIGTLALRSEELTLPNGSKMALGIDDGHWVLVHQKEAGAPFRHYECDLAEKKIILDNKTGGEREFAEFKQLINYFFTHAMVDDLVTLLPPSL